MSNYIDIWLFCISAKKKKSPFLQLHNSPLYWCTTILKNQLSLNGYLGSLPIFWYYKKVEAKNAAVDSLSHVQPFCDPINCGLPGSSVHSISQTRILERVAISFSRGSSWIKACTRVSCVAGGFFTAEPLGKPQRIPCVYDNFTHIYIYP